MRLGYDSSSTLLQTNPLSLLSTVHCYMQLGWRLGSLTL